MAIKYIFYTGYDKKKILEMLTYDESKEYLLLSLDELSNIV